MKVLRFGIIGHEEGPWVEFHGCRYEVAADVKACALDTLALAAIPILNGVLRPGERLRGVIRPDSRGTVRTILDGEAGEAYAVTLIGEAASRLAKYFEEGA